MGDAVTNLSAVVSQVAPIVWRDSVAPACEILSSYSDTLGDWSVVMPQARNISSTFRDVSVVAISSTAAVEAGSVSMLLVGAVALIGLISGVLIWKSGVGQKFADWLVPIHLPAEEGRPTQMITPPLREGVRFDLPPSQIWKAALPPPQGSDVWRGDLPKDPWKDRMEVISVSEKTLVEDDLGQRLYLWFLRKGFVFGEDMQAAMVASFLKTGPLLTRDFWNYLMLRFNLGPFGALRASWNLVDLAKQGVVHLEKEKGDIRLSLANPRTAERWLDEYKQASRQRALILGLIPAPSTKPVSEPQEDPLQLIERTVRVRAMATEVVEHPQNEEAIRLAARLLRKLGKRQRLSEAKVATFERQAEEIWESNRPKPIPVFPKDPPPPLPPPNTSVSHIVEILNAETLRARLDVMDHLVQQLWTSPHFAERDKLARIQGRMSAWRRASNGAPKTRVALDFLQLDEWIRAEENHVVPESVVSPVEPPPVTNGDNGIKFDGFPKSLEFDEASRILTRNGFEVRREGGGSHCIFTHSTYRDVTVTLSSHNSKQNTPQERVGHVKRALRALAKHGTQPVW